MSSVSPRPRTLFVSLRSPSRFLSKNAVSFFLRDVISQAYSSPSSSSSSSSSLPSSSTSAFRAHSVRVVTASWAFSRNGPLSSILAAATWSSSSVFMSYLKDVQFSSSHGFGLGPVVAAGNVVYCNWLRFSWVLEFGFYVTLFSWEWCPLVGGGGALLFAACSASCVFFAEGVPSVAFDAQCSRGPANSL